MTKSHGEPFRPEPFYKIIKGLPRFVYEHFIGGPLRESRYQRLSPECRENLEKEQESKGIEAALNYNS